MPEDVELLSAEVKTLSFNLESNKKENERCIEDIQIHLNDMGDQLDTIQNNHLVHLKNDIKWLKWVIGVGLALLAIVIGTPSIISLILQLRIV